MKKILLSLVVLMTTLAPQACAQRTTSSDYNYRKAVDAFIDDDDDDKAMELVTKQLEETPAHIDSRFLRAKIYCQSDKYSSALNDLSYALKHYNGKPLVYKSTIYGFQGEIYNAMEHYTDAAESFKMAMKFAKKDNPERLQDYMFDYAQALFMDDKMDEAEKVYNAMLKADSGDCAAMVGLARNRRDQGRFDEAMSWLEKAESYDASYADIYRFKMQICDKMGKADETVDAALKYYELDEDASPEFAAKYAVKHYTYGIAKVKAEMNKENAPSKWITLLTRMYETHCDYAKALEMYEKVEGEYGSHYMVSYYKSQCLCEMGQFNKAIKEISKAIELIGNNQFVSSRGDIYRSAGMYKEAIADYTVSMEEDPSSGYEYYAIGWSYELMGNKEKALEYFNQGIDIDKSYAYLFVSRGDLLKEKGEINAAKVDYEKVLEIDNEVEDGSCRHYALLGLGKEDEAIEWINKIIDSCPNDGGSYYDKACLCARMGRTDDALTSLETAFKKGYRRFAHLEHDQDMESLRNLPKYKALVEEYKNKPIENYIEEPEITIEAAEALISEVQMKKMVGGTYEVPCTINGLPLKFIFDTGASDVTISSVEANFMLKNDYLTVKDFKGSRKYITADGDVSEGAVICIKEVLVGDVTLKNIEASVVKNQKAPLLLGQSVLERFGKITIDNENSTLIIKH